MKRFLRLLFNGLAAVSLLWCLFQIGGMVFLHSHSGSWNNIETEFPVEMPAWVGAALAAVLPALWILIRLRRSLQAARLRRGS